MASIDLKHEPIQPMKTMRLMALKALELIRKRAFPPAHGAKGEPTKSVTGKAAKRLSPGYAAWKAEYLAGTSQQKASSKAATLKGRAARAQAVGDKMKASSLRLRAGMASAVAKMGNATAPANQQLTMETVKALGILRETSALIRIGFATEAARLKAEKLQIRNDFWPMSKDEEKAVLDMARQAGHKFAKSVKVTGGSIRIVLG